MNIKALEIHNGSAISLNDCPLVSIEDFREAIISDIENDCHISALFCSPIENDFRLYAIINNPPQGILKVISCNVGKEYPSITLECPQAHLFEREIFESWGINPIGHPWLKKVRFPSSNDSKKSSGIGKVDYFSIKGSDVHEVAVGPVHAGVIEPGHFRFQCHGETVYHLEISLGYQHRGIEQALVGGPNQRTLHYMETLAGDTTIGHATAYSQIMESLSRINVPPSALSIRGIAEELERLANHAGDLGAIAGDIGFLPTQNYCGRIRGDILNITAMLCGSRFGRGLVIPGGVNYNISSKMADQILAKIETIYYDLENAITLLFETPSVLARLEAVGVLSNTAAKEIGIVGLAARASGLELDIRNQFPYGIYRFSSLPVFTQAAGDCLARAYIRWLEIKQSILFIQQQVKSLGNGKNANELREIQTGMLAVSLVEGWRGEICHVAITNENGKFSTYKIIDPSFHNWFGLAYAMRNQEISDFPLCNKSFNLSYCGHDL